MVFEGIHLCARAVNRQLFNPTTVKHRHFDCHIATAKLCGTHWIKYMLSLALAERYALPPPASIRDDSIVGHTKTPPKYKDIPQIAVTHSHPHYLLRAPRVFDVLKLPRFVVMVRDPRDILVSMYEKSKGPHLQKKMGAVEEVTFSRFIRGDVTGRTRIGDIWNVMLFFNGWGPVVKAHPGHVLAIRYEDLKSDTAGTLRRICDHAKLSGITDDMIARAVAGSSKEHMRAQPAVTATQFDKIVNIGQRSFRDWYAPDDRAFIDDACRRFLRHDFGYRISEWET